MSLALTVLWNLTGMQCFNKFAKLYFEKRFIVEKSLHLNDFQCGMTGMVQSVQVFE